MASQTTPVAEIVQDDLLWVAREGEKKNVIGGLVQ